MCVLHPACTCLCAVVLEPHIRKPLKLMKMHATPITAVTTVDS